MANSLLLLNGSGHDAKSAQPKPSEQLAVSGTISQVDETGVFAVLPSYSHNYNYGPLESAYPGAPTPSVGDRCLVIFDERRVPWLIAFAA